MQSEINHTALNYHGPYADNSDVWEQAFAMAGYQYPDSTMNEEVQMKLEQIALQSHLPATTPNQAKALAKTLLEITPNHPALKARPFLQS